MSWHIFSRTTLLFLPFERFMLPFTVTYKIFVSPRKFAMALSNDIVEFDRALLFGVGVFGILFGTVGATGGGVVISFSPEAVFWLLAIGITLLSLLLHIIILSFSGGNYAGYGTASCCLYIFVSVVVVAALAISPLALVSILNMNRLWWFLILVVVVITIPYIAIAFPHWVARVNGIPLGVSYASIAVAAIMTFNIMFLLVVGSIRGREFVHWLLSE
jgi:hypothetical protein